MRGADYYTVMVLTMKFRCLRALLEGSVQQRDSVTDRRPAARPVRLRQEACLPKPRRRQAARASLKGWTRPVGVGP